MHRNHLPGLSESVAHAVSLYPESVQPLLTSSRSLHICGGVSPWFAGLHSFGVDVEGRDTYENTAHMCWTYHLKALPLSRRTPTVVIPTEQEDQALTVVHEFAHALDEIAGFPEMPERFTRNCAYARTNRAEALACAMSAYISPDMYLAQRHDWIRGDYLDPADEVDLTRDDVQWLELVLERAAAKA